jgi:hypothetical protein
MARPSRPHLVADAPIQLVSMKPPTEPGVQRAPRVPAIARPEMRPKIRALTDSDLAPDGNLGRYAPPRAGAHQPVRSSVTIWIYLGIIALIAVVAAAVGIALTQ